MTNVLKMAPSQKRNLGFLILQRYYELSINELTFFHINTYTHIHLWNTLTPKNLAIDNQVNYSAKEINCHGNLKRELRSLVFISIKGELTEGKSYVLSGIVALNKVKNQNLRSKKNGPAVMGPISEPDATSPAHVITPLHSAEPLFLIPIWRELS